MSNNSVTERPDPIPPYWLLIALAPVLTAFVGAVRAYLAPYSNRANWREIVFTFVNWTLLGTFTPFIYFLGRRFPVKKPRRLRALFVHSVGVLTLWIFWGTLGLVVGKPLHQFDWPLSPLKIVVCWILITLPWSLIIYVLMLGCVYAFIYYGEARERESLRARLAVQLAEARLSALRTQLSPHFLFNSLNAITVLVRDQKSEEASQMLELLSDVLREVLQTKKGAETTLDEELAFIEKYLTIEQVRFSDRLEVRWSIELGTRDVFVPEFILQPLVENAIRHGIAHRSGGGLIEIVARESNREMVLSVRDNGPGYCASLREGLGLTNTRDRLSTLYGSSARLELIRAEVGQTIATVGFPIRRSADE
jgi:two-component system LytT family sensor kinase